MAYKMNVGDRMPSFKAKDQTGHVFSSDDLEGGPAVIFFYPKDDTPGCTKEACSFRDNMESLDDVDAIVIGISPDNALSHEAFIQKYDLNFTLLSDESLEVCKKYDVIQNNRLERTTFIVDSQGIIRWIERPVNVEGHTERVLNFLHEMAEQ